jgi:hypothetical protein
VNVAINPSLGSGRRIGSHEAGIAVRRRHCRSELPIVAPSVRARWATARQGSPSRSRSNTRFAVCRCLR